MTENNLEPKSFIVNVSIRTHFQCLIQFKMTRFIVKCKK